MNDRATLVISAPDGYTPEVGAAVWRLDDARRRTYRLLKTMPPEYIDVQTRGNTIGTILYHLALIETDWLYVEILEEPVPDELRKLLPADDRDEQGILTAVRGESLDAHKARLNAVRELLRTRLRGMTTKEFHRPRSLPDYDVSPAWVLHHLAQHEAEHRGEVGSVIEHLAAGTQ